MKEWTSLQLMFPFGLYNLKKKKYKNLLGGAQMF